MVSGGISRAPIDRCSFSEKTLSDLTKALKMAAVIRLTAGLRHMPVPRLLKPGEIFIVRFKNALRGYKVDVWIGVVLPHKFGPDRHLRRPPVGAQPEEGQWLTHLKDRMYPLYLPGRNMYRWASLPDIFVFNEKTINIMNRADRPHEGEVWEELATLIKTKPSLDFWKDMSLQELGAKGNRGRDIRIIMPAGYNDEKDESEQASHDEADEDNEEEINDESGRASPPKVQATSKSFIESRNHIIQSDQGMNASASALNLGKRDITTPNSRARELPRANSNVNPVANANISFRGQSGTAREADPLTKPASSFTSSNTSGTMPFIPGSRRPSIKTENSSGQSNYSLPAWVTRPVQTLQASQPYQPLQVDHPAQTMPAEPNEPDIQPLVPPSMLDLKFGQLLTLALARDPAANGFLTMCESLIVVRNKPEHMQLRSFIIGTEFSPRLVEFNPDIRFVPSCVVTNDAEDNKVSYLLGDKLQIGQSYCLEAITNTEGLREAMTSLGNVYEQARSFEMRDMIHDIAIKLQVCWNSYSGLSQCQTLLEIAKIVFWNDTGAKNGDPVQTWFVPFMAETYDLFDYECHEGLLALLRAHPRLQAEVLSIRTEFRLQQPALFADALGLLRSRGVFHL